MKIYIAIMLFCGILLGSCTDKDISSFEQEKSKDIFSCMLRGDLHMHIADEDPEILNESGRLTVKANYGNTVIKLQFQENIHNVYALQPGIYKMLMTVSDEQISNSNRQVAAESEAEIIKCGENSVKVVFKAKLTADDNESTVYINDGSLFIRTEKQFSNN